MSTPHPQKKRKIAKDARKKSQKFKQIQLEILDIYGCLATAWNAGCDAMCHLGGDEHDVVAYATGCIAKDEAEAVAQNVAGEKATDAAWEYNGEWSDDSGQGAAEDAAWYQARLAVDAAAVRVAENAGGDRYVAVIDRDAIAKAACLSAINDRRKIREEIEEKCMSLLKRGIEEKDVYVAAEKLITYEGEGLCQLQKTILVQKMFILFRFERLLRMINQDRFTKKFETLVENLGCTLKYQTLYLPTLDPLVLSSCFLTSASVHIPREIVGVIVSYCGLDASSKKDEESIVKRIINST